MTRLEFRDAPNQDEAAGVSRLHISGEMYKPKLRPRTQSLSTPKDSAACPVSLQSSGRFFSRESGFQDTGGKSRCPVRSESPRSNAAALLQSAPAVRQFV